MHDFHLMNRNFNQCWSTVPLISTKRTITSHLSSLNIKREQHLTLEITVLAWDRHKNVAGFNRLMGSQPPPLLKTLSPTAILI